MADESRKFKRTPSILSRVRGFFFSSSSDNVSSLVPEVSQTSTVNSVTPATSTESLSSSVVAETTNENGNEPCAAISASPSPKSCPLQPVIQVTSPFNELAPLVERRRANSALTTMATPIMKAKAKKKDYNKYLGLFSVDLWYLILSHLSWKDLKKMLLLNKQISKIAKKVCLELRRTRSSPLQTINLPGSGLDACIGFFFVLGAGKSQVKRKNWIPMPQSHCIVAHCKPSLPPSESDIQIDSVNSPVEGRTYVQMVGVDFGLCYWVDDDDDPSKLQNAVRVAISDGQSLRFYEAWVDERTETFKKKKKAKDEAQWLWFMKRKEIKYRQDRQTIFKHAPIATDDLGHVYVVSEAHTNDTLRVEKRDCTEGNIVLAFSEKWPLKDVRGLAAKVYYKNSVSPGTSPIGSPATSPSVTPAQSPLGSPATSPISPRRTLLQSVSNESVGKESKDTLKEPKKSRSKPTLASNNIPVMAKETQEVSHIVVAVADFSERSNTSRLHIFDGETGEHLRLIRECNKAEGSFSKIDIGVDDEGRDVVFVVDKTKGLILVLDIIDGRVLQQIGTGVNEEGQSVLRDPKSVLFVPSKSPTSLYDLWVVDSCSIHLF
eukprot:TRINITY_DN49_c0_g1_i1.p1 TRINITY_DN49_c0_g1~~TRINITY_DN49_c0_g1_i1.p1  ORF type:complete len:604 (-),score=118.93 TRINITY_DN49_c0_g1_i1:83-1894(-)